MNKKYRKRTILNNGAREQESVCAKPSGRLGLRLDLGHTLNLSSDSTLTW